MTRQKQESPATAFRQQLESLYTISIEIARLHEMQQVLDRAFGFCLDLTQSAFGFIGLLVNDGREMDVAAIKGFEPLDPNFYDNFRLIPVRPSVSPQGSGLRVRAGEAMEPPVPAGVSCTGRRCG